MQDIKQNAPKGATHYFIYEGIVKYFFKTKYGFRQIKDNLIVFYDSGLTVQELSPI